MRPVPARSLKLALLMVLLMPLQAIAAVTDCAQSAQLASSSAGPSAGPSADRHCDHGDRGALHLHHACGSCCCIAAVGNSLADWSAPRFPDPPLFSPRLTPPPSVAVDRLDRPPRLPFA